MPTIAASKAERAYNFLDKERWLKIDACKAAARWSSRPRYLFVPSPGAFRVTSWIKSAISNLSSSSDGISMSKAT